MARLIRRRGLDERGAELIELAVSMPLLLLLMCGIFDFGLLFQRMEVLTNAAREGARLASLPGYTQAEVEQRVNDYLQAGGVVEAATVTLEYQQGSAGSRTFNIAVVKVQCPYQLAFIGPLLSFFGGGAGDVVLPASAAMRIEGQGS